MAPLKRWLARLLGIGILLATGWFAFDYAKSRPRCVITTKTHAIHFSADGNTLVTGYTGMYLGPIYQMGEGKPPLKVWDTRSGNVVRTLLNDLDAFSHFVISSEVGLVAVNCGQSIRIADWDTGEEWALEFAPGVVESMQFSPRGDLLSVRTGEPVRGLALIDVKRRAILQRWSGNIDDLGFSADGSRWYFLRDDRLHLWNIAESRLEDTLAVAGRLHFVAADSLFAHVSPDDLALVICDARRMRLTNRLNPAWTARPNIAARANIIAGAGFAFSPGGRLAATYMSGYSDLVGPLELWEVDSGRRLAVLPEFGKGYAWFVNEDTLFFFDYTHAPAVEVACIDPEQGVVRWQRPGKNGRFFPTDNTTAICATVDATWDFIDLATGQTRDSLPQPFVSDGSMVAFNKDAQMLCNMGRRHSVEMPISWREWLHRWIDTESGGVQVIDTRGQRVLADIHCSVNAGGVVSGDGTTLCVYDFSFGPGFGTIGPSPPEQHAFRFYDLHSNKPWLWAIAAPAGIMIVWLLWRTRRGRRSNATTPAATVGPGPSHGEPAA
jgi:hypothetical protein